MVTIRRLRVGIVREYPIEKSPNTTARTTRRTTLSMYAVASALPTARKAGVEGGGNGLCEDVYGKIVVRSQPPLMYVVVVIAVHENEPMSCSEPATRPKDHNGRARGTATRTIARPRARRGGLRAITRAAHALHGPAGGIGPRQGSRRIKTRRSGALAGWGRGCFSPALAA